MMEVRFDSISDYSETSRIPDCSWFPPALYYLYTHLTNTHSLFSFRSCGGLEGDVTLRNNNGCMRRNQNPHAYLNYLYE